MTLIAGAFLLDAEGTIPPHLTTELVRLAARSPTSEVSVHTLSTPRCFAVKVDVGAFQDPALSVRDDGSFAAMMGDALIVPGRSRNEQLTEVAAACSAGDDATLRQARGTYSFVQFDATTARLTLVSDPLGVRPLYYCVQDEMLIFSSTLRVLDSLTLLRRSVSLVGLTEQAVFGYSLAQRTPYEEIQLLREAQILTCDTGGMRSRSYFDWGAHSDSPRVDYRDAVAELAECFEDAVRLRLGADRSTRAFLSGGLDSRSIVSTLVDQGLHVSAFNFSFSGTQDAVYAEAFARDAGTACTFRHIPRDEESVPPKWSQMMADTLIDAPDDPTRPRIVWSGDGGSVGLGHVHLDAEVVDLLNEGNFDDGIARFLASNKFVVPSSLFNSASRRRLAGLLRSEVAKETERYAHPDASRRLYLFLLLNGNRRHMHRHFEDIDLHRLEFLLPFYDAKVMKLVCGFSSTDCVGHRLYMDFFEHLPAFARRSPWQTYPGHVPCPIAGSGDYTYQWTTGKNGRNRRQSAQRSASSLFRSALAPEFPNQFMSRLNAHRLAALHYVLGNDCDYLNHIVKEFVAYSRSGVAK